MLAYLVMALVGALLGATYGGHDLRIFHRWRFFLLALVVPVVGSVGFSSAIFSDRLFCYEPDALVRLRGAKIPASAIAEFHMTGFYHEFGLIPRTSDGQEEWRESLFVDSCNICGPTMVYLNHGILNLGRVMARDARGEKLGRATDGERG